MSDPKALIDRLGRMKALRGTLDSHLQECADYVIPRKNDVTRTQQPGNKRGIELYDSTGAQSAETLAGALHGMLTNPASLWFEFTFGDDAIDNLDEVRLWLQKAAIKTHNVLNNSNFQTEVHEVYIDETWAGTAFMSTEEDDETVVRFGTRHISECFIEESNRAIIDTLFRVYKWTLKQIVQEWGLKSLPKKVQEEYGKSDDKQYEILHAVYPRDKDEIKGKAGKLGYPYASEYVLICEKHTLEEGGYREFPYVVPRWTKTSGEVYGRSPTMKVLPDIKMINEMMKTTLEGAQMTVRPPMMAPDDGFLLPLKLHPNGINYYRSGSQDRIEPLTTGGKIDFGQMVMEDVRKRIREAFYVDQLQMPSGPQMTATEVMKRTEEKLMLMGPMLGRQQSEFLRPLIDRVFAIMLRKNIVPPMPKSISGKKMDVRYSSLVARAQRISEANNIQRTLAALQPFIAMDPSVADNFNGDNAAKHISNIHGFPQEILRNKDELDKIRKAKAQAQQVALQQQQQQHQADLVQKVGPTAVKAQEVQSQ
jgi:hypothetical protein